MTEQRNKKRVLINKEFGESAQHNFIRNVDMGVLRHLVERYNVKKMIDVGCGLGDQVKMAMVEGIDVIGVDGDYTLDIFKDKKHFILHDYTKGPLEIKPRDLGWSVEFVEHVHEKYCPNYFKTFQKCQNVMITYAVPWQRGFHHVNEQHLFYWIEMFLKYGLKYDKEETLGIKAIATNKWIKSTALFFKNTKELDIE